tara:strand:+ start:303 stop:677 length:375 start_codon:yes stop_codon:yes gene_type:complete
MPNLYPETTDEAYSLLNKHRRERDPVLMETQRRKMMTLLHELVKSPPFLPFEPAKNYARTAFCLLKARLPFREDVSDDWWGFVILDALDHIGCELADEEGHATPTTIDHMVDEYNNYRNRRHRQ